MKKILCLVLALCMVLALAACGGSKTETPKTDAPKTEAPKSETPKADAPKTDAPKTETPADTAVKPDLNYTIRIYSNSNSTERTTWLINEAKAAGFNISIDDNSVISGDTAAVQAANEKKDGDHHRRPV